MKHITELGCEQFSFNAFPPHGYIDFRHFYTSNISIDREFLMSEKIIFDESFNKYGFEDIEFGYRLSKKGMDIYFYPDAIAEHYHPYKSVLGFCIRQENAGAMGVVFKKLHNNEVEWVVQVEQISMQWKHYIDQVSKLSFQENFKMLDQIIHLCQKLEDENLIQQYDLEKIVSNAYRVLFRFFYEKGIIENSYKIDDAIVQKVFAVYFIPQIQEYIQDIIRITHLESIEFNTDFAEKNDAKIIIEVEDYILIEKLQKEYADVMSDIFIRIKSDAKELDNNYIYKPKNGFMLSVNSIKQTILFLKNNSVDSVLLSFGLVDLPYIGISKDLENNIIYKNNGMSIENLKSKKMSGKIIRLISETYATKSNIKDLINQSVDDYGYWNKRNCGYIEEGIILYQPTSYQKNKKIIFVFPIFLAVGGVERNTAEIIEALKDEYDFVVVNFERLNESLGSLQHQFIKTCLSVYDVTELSSHDGILNYLKILNQFYRPELIWICNGSPWMEHNLANIRSIFKNSAIVDQEVYDTDEGWVRLYKEKNQNLLSFDGFIAINSRIKNIFINDVNIDEKKVDLIYSVMSDEKRNKALNYTRNELLKKYNLNSDQKYIISIGRLTHQKAPLDLIHLIQKVIDQYGEEFKFIIVGSGELSIQVDQLIKKYNLQKYTVKLDYIDNTYELHLIAEAIIFTSLYEGLSIALLEALSVGTPGISTDVGDTKLVFELFENGLIFDEIGVVDTYLKNFSYFIENYQFYKNNAMKNKHQIIDKFSIKNIATQYKIAFEKAIKSKVV